ncbi:MAG TPA: MauE/DoxX family redox-associated membrane protein [Candidatus Sulfopaludibacter sp.]|jgi:uncharacterized membrane protein YphA (DoxX/SURF4 family)|nr:MauE/DoxX family redox-associated membrane protein [Candidatus Sulfopaludibacter sp.]
MTSSPNKILRITTVVLRVLVGLVFVYAAYVKLKDPWALFAMSIDSYGILPLRWVEFVARALPWFEMVLGVVLISGYFQRLSTGVGTLLVLSFITAMLWAKLHGKQIDCGCFGPGEAIGPLSILRDASIGAALLFVTVMSFWKPRTAEPTQSV